MGQIKEIYITNVVCDDERKFGFARVIETAEEVFIPPHVILENNPQKGDQVVAELIPNIEGQRVKLRVNMVYDPDGPFRHLLKNYRHKEKQAPVMKEPTHAEVVQWMCDHLNAYPMDIYTTQQLVEEIEASHNYRMQTATAGRDLDHLFKQGRIAKLQLFATVKNSRAARTMWCGQQNATQIFDKMVELYENNERRIDFG